MSLRTDQKVELLSRLDLFSACSRRELQRVAALVDRVDAPAGEVLMREGTPGHECFVILDGTAKVTLRGRRVASLGPGDFFGEMALLDQGPRSATVVAETPMSLVVLGARDFGALLEEVPTVTRKLLRGLARRFRAAEKRPMA